MTVAEPTPEIRNVVATVKGVAPLSWGRYYQDDDGLERGDKESPGEYEERTWMHRFHTNGNGTVVIPGMAFKRCLDNVVRFLGQKIKGRGSSTWTKHFVSGCAGD